MSAEATQPSPLADPARIQRLFGFRIAMLRLDRNWSQQELAERLGISHSTVSRYEDGLVMPSISTLIRLRETLETTLDYLLAGILAGDPPAAVRH